MNKNEDVDRAYGSCICDVLRDLVPFVQFKKHEKHPWRSVTFSKVEAFRISGPIVEVKKSALINDYENIIACSEESEQSKV